MDLADRLCTTSATLDVIVHEDFPFEHQDIVAAILARFGLGTWSTAAGLGRFLAPLSLFGTILARFGLACQTLQALAHVASIQRGQSSACRGIWMSSGAEREKAKEVIEYRINCLWNAVPDKDTVIANNRIPGKEKARLTVVPRALSLSKSFEVQKFSEVPRPTSSLHSSHPPSYLLFCVSRLPLSSILLAVWSPLLRSTPCSALIVSSNLHSHPLHVCLPLNSIFPATLCLRLSPLFISSMALSPLSASI